MKNLLISIGFLFVITLGFSQSDSTLNLDVTFKGIPAGKILQDWVDTTTTLNVLYTEKYDGELAVKETLILKLNMDSIKIYKPQWYNIIVEEYYNSTQRQVLIKLGKEAAKERFFNYKRYFK